MYAYYQLYIHVHVYLYIYSVAYRTAALLLMVIAEGPQGLAGAMDEEERNLEWPEVPPPIMDCRFCGKLNMPRLEWTVHLHTQHNHQITKTEGTKGSISWCNKFDIPQPMAGSPAICIDSGGGGGDVCQEDGSEVVWSPAENTDDADNTDGRDGDGRGIDGGSDGDGGGRARSPAKERSTTPEGKKPDGVLQSTTAEVACVTPWHNGNGQQPGLKQGPFPTASTAAEATAAAAATATTAASAAAAAAAAAAAVTVAAVVSTATVATATATTAAAATVSTAMVATAVAAVAPTTPVTSVVSTTGAHLHHLHHHHRLLQPVTNAACGSDTKNCWTSRTATRCTAATILR
jgi:hypothetical protein